MTSSTSILLRQYTQYQRKERNIEYIIKRFYKLLTTVDLVHNIESMPAFTFFPL